jgi:hypothetical protein
MKWENKAEKLSVSRFWNSALSGFMGCSKNLNIFENRRKIRTKFNLLEKWNSNLSISSKNSKIPRKFNGNFEQQKNTSKTQCNIHPKLSFLSHLNSLISGSSTNSNKFFISLFFKFLQKNRKKHLKKLW